MVIARENGALPGGPWQVWVNLVPRTTLCSLADPVRRRVILMCLRDGLDVAQCGRR